MDEKIIIPTPAETAKVEETAQLLADVKAGRADLVRPIYNPEAFAFRSKARGAAARGEIANNDCKHPFSFIEQYVDTDPAVHRKGNPINLFECTRCSMLLWLVDPWGNDKPDV